jgi:hypothetical protein
MLFIQITKRGTMSSNCNEKMYVFLDDNEECVDLMSQAIPNSLRLNVSSMNFEDIAEQVLNQIKRVSVDLCNVVIGVDNQAIVYEGKRCRSKPPEGFLLAKYLADKIKDARIFSVQPEKESNCVSEMLDAFKNANNPNITFQRLVS